MSSLSPGSRRPKNPQTFILIGDGFDELEVVSFLHKFRQKGLSIKSVSLFDKVVYSRQGVGLEADYELADTPFDRSKDCLLILPAGGRNGEMLRRDARVRSLLQDLSAHEADIAVTDADSSLASDVDQLVARPTYIPTTDQNLDEFVERLTKRLA